MRRLARHLFTLCSAVSSVLCVAVLVVWPLSYTRRLFVERAKWVDDPFTDGRVCSAWRQLTISGGRVRLADMTELETAAAGEDALIYQWARSFEPHAGPAGWGYGEWTSRRTEIDGTWGALGVRFGWREDDGLLYRGLVVPCPLLALALSVIPVPWLASRTRAWRVLARARSGLCPACGYDLRASAEGCPECGVVREVTT